MLSKLILVSVLIASCSATEGSSIKIDVNHHYSDDGLTEGMTIRCGLVKDQCCYQTNIIIQLSKDNVKKIASVQGHNSIDYDRLQKQSVRADGFIDHDQVSNSYLSVNFDHVTKEDSGLYTCSFIYLDYKGNSHYEKTSQNITFEKTISDQKTEDLFKHLFAKISDLEKLVEFEKNKTQQQISGLQTKDLSPVAFSYGYIKNDNTKVIEGQTLLFTELIMDLGGHFNPSNGTFTAPIKGLYVFHLVVATWTENDSMKLDLMSGTKIIATLHCRNNASMDQSSVSTAVFLDRGELVRPKVYVTSRDYIDQHRQYSYFTGYLMKPI